MRIAIAPVLALMSLTPLLAQETTATTIPHLVRFTGTFHPANGLPAGPTESATLSVYAEEQGGTPLWQETQNVPLDADGHYTAMLGATQNDGVPLDLFTASAPRWLGVMFNRIGETEQPRVQLVSVPYAMRAADAETLGGQPASAYLLNPNASPTGTANSGTTTSVSSSTAKLKAHNTFGNQNYIPYFTDNSGDLGNSVLYQSGSYVGIGTTSPVAPLEVRAAANEDLYVAQNQNLSSGVTVFSVNDANSAVQPLEFAASQFYFAGGYIGIGTATPTAPLDLEGVIPSAAMIVARYTGSSSQAPTSLPMAVRTARGTQSSPSAVQQGDFLGPYVTQAFDGSVFGSAGQIIYYADQNWTSSQHGSYLTFTTVADGTTSATERMRINNAGNVGIGTTTPAAQLDVAGNINFSGLISYQGVPVQQFSSTSNNAATGISALASITTGTENTAVGNAASIGNTAGSSNTAIGYLALESNTGGDQNTAVGAQALHINNGTSSSEGSGNTAVGWGALGNNTTGNSNIALGLGAGSTITGSNNIEIGSTGTASDSGVIRIGNSSNQTSFYAAGVSNVNLTSDPNALIVLIDSVTGQLGVASTGVSGTSYRRYKKPNAEGSQPIQYGLIAEAVAQVSPDPVAHAADGQIEAVRYQVPDSMLLNEVQRQQKEITSLKGENQALQERLARLEASMAKLTTGGGSQ
jgi:hypothetical protein